jgi:chromosome segregation ATPase
MAYTKPRGLIAVSYEEWAREYLRGLPPEHFMEAIGQSTQLADLEQALKEAQRRAEEEKSRADELQRRLAEAERELAQLRAASQSPPTRRNNGSKTAK